jgi:hypothetical protein
VAPGARRRAADRGPPVASHGPLPASGAGAPAPPGELREGSHAAAPGKRDRPGGQGRPTVPEERSPPQRARGPVKKAGPATTTIPVARCDNRRGSSSETAPDSPDRSASVPLRQTAATPAPGSVRRTPPTTDQTRGVPPPGCPARWHPTTTASATGRRGAGVVASALRRLVLLPQPAKSFSLAPPRLVLLLPGKGLFPPGVVLPPPPPLPSLPREEGRRGERREGVQQYKYCLLRKKKTGMFARALGDRPRKAPVAGFFHHPEPGVAGFSSHRPCRTKEVAGFSSHSPERLAGFSSHGGAPLAGFSSHPPNPVAGFSSHPLRPVAGFSSHSAAGSRPATGG